MIRTLTDVGPSSSWVSVTTPSTWEVPLSTATAFLVASATTSVLLPAETRRSGWKGRAEDGAAWKSDVGAVAAERRVVCAAAVTEAMAVVGGGAEGKEGFLAMGRWRSCGGHKRKLTIHKARRDTHVLDSTTGG